MRTLHGRQRRTNVGGGRLSREVVYGGVEGGVDVGCGAMAGWWSTRSEQTSKGVSRGWAWSSKEPKQGGYVADPNGCRQETDSGDRGRMPSQMEAWHDS